jgi:hypothetical protein
MRSLRSCWKNPSPDVLEIGVVDPALANVLVGQTVDVTRA